MPDSTASSLRDAPKPDIRTRRRNTLVSAEVITGVVKVLDFCFVLAAAGTSFTVYLIFVANKAPLEDRYLLTALVGATLLVIGLQRVGAYRFTQFQKLRWQLARVAIVWAATLSCLLLLAFVTKVSDAYSRGWALSWAASTLVLLQVERCVLYLTIARWMQKGILVRRVAIVGAGEAAERLIAKLQQCHDGNITIVGIFDDRRSRIAPVVCGLPVIGTTDDLIQFSRRTEVDEVIVALPLSADQRLKGLFEKLKLLPVDLRLSAEPMADAFPVRGISYIGDVPMLEVIDKPLKHWNAVAKWIEDTALSWIMLVVLAPAMAIIALLIKLDSRGPVFFAQDRFGFNNQVIRVLKFRTMYVDRSDPSGAQRTVRNDPRVTRIGRVLRTFSLDELPQLINVVRGEMSLVGPRPHAISMKAGDRLYHDAIEEYLHRHRVKPGITGWAQVNGLRGEINSLEKAQQRVMYDLNYIEKWSLWLDLRILLLSISALLHRENAY